MKSSSVQSPWARLAFAALGLAWSAVGWCITYQGGFVSSLDKRSTHTVFVGGMASQGMAAIFFALSTIAVFVVLQSLHVGRVSYIAVALANFGLPALYLYIR